MKVCEGFYCRQDVQDWSRKYTTCTTEKGSQMRSQTNYKLYNVVAPWKQFAVKVASQNMKTRYNWRSNSNGFEEGALV